MTILSDLAKSFIGYVRSEAPKPAAPPADGIHLESLGRVNVQMQIIKNGEPDIQAMQMLRDEISRSLRSNKIEFSATYARPPYIYNSALMPSGHGVHPDTGGRWIGADDLYKMIRDITVLWQMKQRVLGNRIAFHDHPPPGVGTPFVAKPIPGNE